MRKVCGADALCTALYLTSAYMLAGNTSADLMHAVASVPSPLLLTGKAAVAFAGSYHTINGMRHLVCTCSAVRALC